MQHFYEKRKIPELDALIEELTIAEKEMRALPTELKDQLESFTGFSADAIASLYSDCLFFFNVLRPSEDKE